jgi:hypothetical protein
MSQFSKAAGQTAADFPKTLGLSNLTKQHGYEMIPGTEPFGAALCTMPPHQSVEMLTIKQRNQLTEKTRMLYHGPSSLFLGSCYSWLNNNALQGGFFSRNYSTPFYKTYFGQE